MTSLHPGATAEPLTTSAAVSLDPAPPAADGGEPHPVPHVPVAVVGTGFSGIAASLRLTQEGFDHVLFERGTDVGGTWRDNSYPGAGCDVMSLLYSLSYAPKPDWSSTFGTRDEIQQYLRDVADRYGVRRRTLFGHEVLDATWDDRAKRWTVRTSQGDYTAGVLVTGTGYLSDPVLPAVPGIADFAGPVFHTSRWDHDVPLAGRRIAVVGTGASAVQVVPELQKVAGSLTVYQRTPPWVAPKKNAPTTDLELRLRRHVPGYQAFRRGFNQWGREVLAFMMARPEVMRRTLQQAALKNLHDSIADEELRAALTPDYTIGCKRILFSSSWYPALASANTELVPAAVDAFTPEGVLAGGTFRPADVVVLATGFEAVDRPIAHRVRGLGGQTLASRWTPHGRSWAGTSTSGFPNLFTLLGPNTALAHSSQTVLIEAQVEHLVAALTFLRDRDLASVEVRPEAEERFATRLAGHFRGSVWQEGGCRSWYQSADGHNPSVWPTTTWRFRREVAGFRPQDHVLTSCAAVPTTPTTRVTVPTTTRTTASDPTRGAS